MLVSTMSWCVRTLVTLGVAISMVSCGPNPRRDVIEEMEEPLPDACIGCMDGSSDAAMGDAVGTDVGDGTPVGDGGDVVHGDTGSDGWIPSMGCTPVGMPIQLTRESRALSRPVYVRAAGTGFVAGTMAQRDGLDNVYFTRVGTDGREIGTTNVSEELGALVEGGAIAPDGAGFVMAYGSNGMGGQDIYLRRVSMDGRPMGTPVRVSNDTEISEAPQVEPVAGGWMVVWRSRNDLTGAARLMAAHVSSSGTVSAPTAVTPDTVAAGSFDLATDGASRVALAYIALSGGMGVPQVQRLSATGSAMGAAMRLTPMGMSFVTDTIGAVLRDDQLLVVWVDNVAGVYLHATRVNLSSGAVSPSMGLTRVGFEVSKVGLALDGTNGYVLAFRAPLMMEGSVAMMRLDGSLGVRDISRVGRAVTGDVVHVASRGDGLYIVGWSDEQPAQTTATVQVMRCP